MSVPVLDTLRAPCQPLVDGMVVGRAPVPCVKLSPATGRVGDAGRRIRTARGRSCHG